jgi:hypothetical protein
MGVNVEELDAQHESPAGLRPATPGDASFSFAGCSGVGTRLLVTLGPCLIRDLLSFSLKLPSVANGDLRQLPDILRFQLDVFPLRAGRLRPPNKCLRRHWNFSFESASSSSCIKIFYSERQQVRLDLKTPCRSAPSMQLSEVPLLPWPTEHNHDAGQCECFWETFMSDNTKHTGLDRKLIALDEDYEVRDWTKSLGCTEEELRAAVKAVGNSAEKVRDFLSKKK